MSVSVLVPVRGRIAHLANLVDGLDRAADAPRFELLVGWMGGEDPRPTLERARRFAAAAVPITGEKLPLAAARNRLAEAAGGEILVFLDVDCIPSWALIPRFAAALCDHDALAVGEARYLPRGFVAQGADERLLRRAARRRPERAALFPAPGEVRLGDEHELFWSLAFAARRSTFRERIGGFDEAYRGYGIEDTDLAMRAAAAAVPLAWVGDATAFHQSHPPTRLRPDGAAALVENARRYRERWGDWPAKGWLTELAAKGLVEWDEAAGTLAARASAVR
ncbi:MAG TPA: glycosyltransferase family 2 protein [Solirubrobacterales bacterium]